MDELTFDFPGLRIGVAEYDEGPTGCTVFHFEGGAMLERDVRGKDVTPYLLACIAEFTEGRSLRTNQALVIANARLAAQLALSLSGRPG